MVLHCVTSLLKQDFEAPYEVIVVDDGSTDNTAGVVEDIDPRVRVIRQVNQGAGVARYTGICAARGELVAFLDSDCTAMPDHLEVLRAALCQHSDIVLAFTQVDHTKTQQIQIEQIGDTEAGIITNPLERLLRSGNFIYAVSIMTYRHIALTCGQHRRRFRAANDYDLCLRIASYGSFAFVRQVTVRLAFPANGISETLGHLQIGFAVVAARDAVSFSGRKDPTIRDALCQRVEQSWPLAAIMLMAKSNLRLGCEVSAIGLRHGRWSVGLRRLWWAWNYYFKEMK